MPDYKARGSTSTISGPFNRARFPGEKPNDERGFGAPQYACCSSPSPLRVEPSWPADDDEGNGIFRLNQDAGGLVGGMPPIRARPCAAAEFNQERSRRVEIWTHGLATRCETAVVTVRT